MDSLTQIVLGAAIGELAQGKKLGNRAMIWGAIAGTIPDLDVFVGKLYSDPVDELAFHRGISHSFFFAATFSYLLSLLTYWIYDKKHYQQTWFAVAFIAMMIASAIAVSTAADFSTLGLMGAGLLMVPTTIYAIYRYKKAMSGNIFKPLSIGVVGWYKLFFWAIITHPMLDCFTVYGTQIFLPFSDMRVSFDNISVADPGYTVPFLICLILASLFTRKSKYRSILNMAGLVLSSIYMMWTFYNKHQINKIVEQTLADEQIAYSRYMTSPTILNNILWSTTVEADSVYYQGQYSFLDEHKKFDLIPIPKNRHLIPDGDGDHTIETLKWFSDNYYNTIVRADGRLQINDLRYGSFSGKALDENDFIFRFVVEKSKNDSYKLDESAGGPPRGREKEMMSTLWHRLIGKKKKISSFKHGVVTSAHALASEVGTEVLRQGGNAFDAAVAVHFALAVVYPRAGNLGGGGFATIHTADGVSSTLDFRETAPGLADRNMYLDEYGNVIPSLSLKGAKASGVPGSVKGMLMLHDSLGSMPVQQLLAPAIALAKYGFPVSENEASRLNTYRTDFLEHNRSQTPYTKPSTWHPGDTLANPALAATLSRLAEYGLDEFYQGMTADLIHEHQAQSSGLITKDDLRAYTAKWREPIVCAYKDYQVISMGPPSSGGIALCQILNGVELLELDQYKPNTPQYIHHLSEVEKRVFAIRNELLGDPDFIDMPIQQLLSDDFAAALFSDIDDTATHQVKDSILQHAMVKEVYETTHFSIADRYGNTVSITTTLNGNYGAFTVVDGAGFLMNNEMDDFTTKPGVANQYGLLGSESNSIAPQKRMLSSMTPTIVLYRGKPFMILGSPGGPTIITSVLQTFLNVIEHQMSIQEAVDAPRFHDQGYPDGILVEQPGIDSAVIMTLQKNGHFVRTAKHIGAVEAILIDSTGTMHGAADYLRGKDDTVEGY